MIRFTLTTWWVVINWLENKVYKLVYYIVWNKHLNNILKFLKKLCYQINLKLINIFMLKAHIKLYYWISLCEPHVNFRQQVIIIGIYFSWPLISSCT